MRLPRLRKGQAISADALNDIIDHIERRLIIGITGASERQTPHGRVVSIVPGKGAVKNGPATSEDCSGGDLQTLEMMLGTQDSDNWDRAEGKRLTMSVITDIGWDSGGGNIVGRIRSLEFDKCGKLKTVGAEGDWVVLVPTESCTSG